MKKGSLSIIDIIKENNDYENFLNKKYNLPEENYIVKEIDDIPSISRSSFIPDKRPVFVIRPFNGNLNHPYGLTNGYIGPDNYRNSLKNDLKFASDLGYERIMINLPAGIEKNDHMCSAQWWTMPNEERKVITEEIWAWLLENEKRKIYIYGGTKKSDWDTHKMLSYENGVSVPDLSKPDDQLWFNQVYEPWLLCSPRKGQIGFGLDASSVMECRDWAINMSEEMRKRGVDVFGEAFPFFNVNENGKTVKQLDLNAINSMPWFGLLRYYRIIDPQWSWTKYINQNNEIGLAIVNIVTADRDYYIKSTDAVREAINTKEKQLMETLFHKLHFVPYFYSRIHAVWYSEMHNGKF